MLSIINKNSRRLIKMVKQTKRSLVTISFKDDNLRIDGYEFKTLHKKDVTPECAESITKNTFVLGTTDCFVKPNDIIQTIENEIAFGGDTIDIINKRFPNIYRTKRGSIQDIVTDMIDNINDKLVDLRVSKSILKEYLEM